MLMKINAAPSEYPQRGQFHTRTIVQVQKGQTGPPSPDWWNPHTQIPQPHAAREGIGHSALMSAGKA